MSESEIIQVDGGLKFQEPLAPASFTLTSERGTVLTITGEGKIVLGPGLSTDEATQEAARILALHFEQYFSDHYVRKDKQNG